MLAPLNYVLYQVLLFFYHLFGGNLGLPIIAITLIIKFILIPLVLPSMKSAKKMQALKPALDRLKEKFKDNKQAIAQETMKLYKENHVNPFASCLPLLIQLPILIALYYVLQIALKGDQFQLIYPFMHNPGSINKVSLGLFNLENSSWVLAVLAGAAQFWQSKMMMRKRPDKPVSAGAKDEDTMAMMNKQMLYFMPFMTVFIGLSLPAGLTLYWFLSTLFTALQQLVMFKKKTSEVIK